jgi:hypothetical protein
VSTAPDAVLGVGKHGGEQDKKGSCFSGVHISVEGKIISKLTITN